MQHIEYIGKDPIRTRDTQPEFTTKNEWVYARLRADILCGVLSPGERLVVSRLAKSYNVSPMPVRDALNRLIQEGFVENTPHAGATVIAISGRKLHEIVTIRMEMEALAASLAAPLLNRDDLDLLESMHQQMLRCAEEDDRIRYEALNWSFHEYVYAHCGNDTLYDMVMTLWRKSCITRTVFVRLPSKLQHSVSEHRKWLDALHAGDAEAVRAIVREHIRHTLDRLEQITSPAPAPAMLDRV